MQQLRLVLFILAIQTEFYNWCNLVFHETKKCAPPWVFLISSGGLLGKSYGCNKMEPSRAFYCASMVSRKHTNWLIMFAWLNFSLPSNHLCYIHPRRVDCIKDRLKGLCMVKTTAFDMCRHLCCHRSYCHCHSDWSVLTISLGALISC